MKKLNLNFVNKAKSMAGLTGLKIKKYSPEILLGVGILAGGAAVGFAIYETRKIDGILEEHLDNRAMIDEAFENGYALIDGGVRDNEGNIIPQHIDYSAKDHKEDIAKLYLITGARILKTYAPVIGFSALSVTCILYSHGILSKRNVAITAAYNALDAGFKQYRKNVIEAYGEEVDQNLKLGRSIQKVEVVEVDENGKEKKVKKSMPVFKNPSDYSAFARFFDETNPLWKKDPEYNLMFLKAQQENATRYLRANGYLFLNDVYDMLGIPRTSEGQAVGWLLKDPHSDGYVDFGIYDGTKEAARDFVNGIEPAILLDFNVDGVIWDRF